MDIFACRVFNLDYGLMEDNMCVVSCIVSCSQADSGLPIYQTSSDRWPLALNHILIYIRLLGLVMKGKVEN